MIMRGFLFILCLLCGSILVMGQKFESIRERADQLVRSRRPDLKLERKEEKTKEAVYNWGTAQDGVRVLYFRGSSQREAIEKMRTTIKFLPAGPGTKRTDVGEEAYSWQDEKTGFAGIRFRKGNVFIDLVAPIDMTEDLARDLAKLIKN